MSRVHYESGLLLQWCSPRSLVIVRRTENDSHYRVTPAAMSQSRFLNPASALLPQNVAHDRAMSRRLDHGRKCRCQEGALASWRRSEAGGDSGAERQAIGWPALVGCRHLGLSLGSFSSIACNYAGLRGEGSTPVPLPPPPDLKNMFSAPRLRDHLVHYLQASDIRAPYRLGRGEQILFSKGTQFSKTSVPWCFSTELIFRYAAAASTHDNF